MLSRRFLTLLQALCFALLCWLIAPASAQPIPPVQPAPDTNAREVSVRSIAPGNNTQTGATGFDATNRPIYCEALVSKRSGLADALEQSLVYQCFRALAPFTPVTPPRTIRVTDQPRGVLAAFPIATENYLCFSVLTTDPDGSDETSVNDQDRRFICTDIVFTARPTNDFVMTPFVR